MYIAGGKFGSSRLHFPLDQANVAGGVAQREFIESGGAAGKRRHLECCYAAHGSIEPRGLFGMAVPRIVLFRYRVGQNGGMHYPDSSRVPQVTKTLERVLSKAGLGSRSEARSWIHARRVKVNGRTIENPDLWVDLKRDRILFDDKPLTSAQKRYVLLYKPKGYITTYQDPEKRSTVYDLIQDVGSWIAPVGRLDLDTSGLLLLTNDTAFAERMTNPDFHVPKTYLIKASTLLSDKQIDKLRTGVDLSDGPTRPAQVQRLRDSAKYTHLEMTITEGRNRQVRRMLEAVDSKVLELVRVGIGKVRIGKLKIGTWREMEIREI